MIMWHRVSGEPWAASGAASSASDALGQALASGSMIGWLPTSAPDPTSTTSIARYLALPRLEHSPVCVLKVISVASVPLGERPFVTGCDGSGSMP